MRDIMNSGAAVRPTASEEVQQQLRSYLDPGEASLVDVASQRSAY
jgi:hypothetical protein